MNQQADLVWRIWIAEHLLGNGIKRGVEGMVHEIEVMREVLESKETNGEMLVGKRCSCTRPDNRCQVTYPG